MPCRRSDPPRGRVLLMYLHIRNGADGGFLGCRSCKSGSQHGCHSEGLRGTITHKLFSS